GRSKTRMLPKSFPRARGESNEPRATGSVFDPASPGFCDESPRTSYLCRAARNAPSIGNSVALHFSGCGCTLVPQGNSAHAGQRQRNEKSASSRKHAPGRGTNLPPNANKLVLDGRNQNLQSSAIRSRCERLRRARSVHHKKRRALGPDRSAATT